MACAQLGTKELVGYYASWEDWNPYQNALGSLPPYVTTGARCCHVNFRAASALVNGPHNTTPCVIAK